nr:sterol desaturase family protein [Planctomycetota bacterium]
AFRFGEGQISGFLSASLGILGLLGVLCYHAPALLTFPDLHRSYDPNVLRVVLLIGLCVALICGLINFLIGRWRALGLIGITATAAAVALGGVTVQADGSNAFSVLPIGLDWFILALIGSALIYVPLERLFVLRREQEILRAGWRLDLQYFLMTHLLVSVIILGCAAAVGRLFSWSINAEVQATVSGLPWWVQFPLIVLVADLAQYWSHRLMHTVPFLWRFHAVHHSAKAMDWLASSRLHLVEVMITRSCVLAPIFVLGFSNPVVLMYVTYIGLQGVFVHANVRLTFGWLHHVLVTPAFHHWHHSEDPRASNTNFAVHLPIIDRVFGTCYFPAGEWPSSYGIGDEPLPDGIVRQHLYPFMPRMWKRPAAEEAAA